MMRFCWLGGIFVAIAFSLPLGMPVDLPAAAPTHTDSFASGWMAYDRGRFDEAFRIWYTLAEQGDVRAQTNLGAMYDTGKGIPEDPEAAVRWYSAAASRGSSEAQYNLALMYSSGRGIQRDGAQALAWYLKAAEQGFGPARYDLGMMHSTGTGVPKNHEIAISWFYKSGLSFFEENDRDGVRMAAEAIHKLAPGHGLENELSEKIYALGAEEPDKNLLSTFLGASTGTAWPVSSGHVITSNHVISESTDLVLSNASGDKILAWPVLRDEFYDLALLEVRQPYKLPSALPLANSRSLLGAAVFTFGFPRIDLMGTTPKLSKGAISRLEGLYGDTNSYQTTVPIQPGNSGGPLFNMRGEVAGVVASMLGLKEKTNGQVCLVKDASIAKKIACLKELLQMLPKEGPVLKTLPSQPGSLETVAERVRGSVLIVLSQ